MISIIVPVYNVERYLEKCIESICRQTWQHLEIILVDDGSTDDSGAICDKWAEKDVRIRVLHKENGGLSDARNAGMDMAAGNWLMFVDSDDFLAPDTASRLYLAATEQECEMAVCNIVRIYEDGATEPFYAPVGKLTVWDGLERFETLKQPSVCNKLFRAELWQGIRFPKGKYYEDTFVYHVLAHRARRIVLTGHDGYFYLSRRESILGNPRYTDRFFDMVEAVRERMAYLLAHQIPAYGEEACLSLYALTAEAEKHIAVTQENAPKFAQMRAWYALAYRHLIGRRDVSLKQKLRLVLLRFLPGLHSKLY